MRPLFAVAMVGSAAGIASAEPARTLDVSGFAGVSEHGSDNELGNSWASEQVPGTGVLLGGRVGVTLLPDLAPASALDPQLGVEGELGVSMSSTGESMDSARRSFFAPVFGWRVHAIARLRSHHGIDPHLVIGVGGESVVSSSPFIADDTDAAFHWGVGASWHASPTWIARLDLRHELTAGRTAFVTSTFELQLGLEKSFTLGEARATPLPPRTDRDGDGVLDDEDRCVDQPETQNGYQDDDGCPDDADLDHDGVANDRDDCPDQAEDVDQYEDDDGCPETDNDSDGVLDAADQCPTEPEDRDGFADDDGCVDPDNDGDTFPDSADTCPSEAETVNGFLDADGCPDALPPALVKITGVVEGLTFTSGARITASGKRVLDAAADMLRKFPDVRIRVEGHTDSKGDYDLNKALSLRRAEAVKWYLVDQGITADRIETAGYGPDHPRVSNKTAAGRAKNRRVEITVIVAGAAAPSDPQLAPATQP